jgi:hypothetical protein
LDIVCFEVQIRVQACHNGSILCQLLNLVLFLLISYLLGAIYIIFCTIIIFGCYLHHFHIFHVYFFVHVFKSSIFHIDSISTCKTVIIVLFLLFFIICLLLESYLFIWITLLSGSVWCYVRAIRRWNKRKKAWQTY